MVNKCDADLGVRVHEELLRLGIETPMVPRTTTDVEKVDAIQSHISSILNVLGVDQKDESIQQTPNRVAQMMVIENFYGLYYQNFPKCTRIPNKMNYRGSYVLERKITIYSMCEHHFVPIIGHANIAYVPQKYILGLSKLNRIAEFFSKRPQVQERLTEQICAAVSFVTESPDVAVQIEASHLCVRSRGIRHTDSTTVTFSGSGVFLEKSSSARDEFVADCR